MKTYKSLNHYPTEREVWLEAWYRTAQASNCSTIEAPTRYADECLKQYKLRFGENVKEECLDSDVCPTTGEGDCGACSGEYCMKHIDTLCECDVMERHESN